MENKKTSKIIKVLLFLITTIILGILLYLAINGKHNKLPGGIETNIPEPKKDTSIKNEIKNTEINIDKFKGDINL